MKMMLFAFAFTFSSLAFASEVSETYLRHKTIEAIEKNGLTVDEVSFGHPRSINGNINAFAGLFTDTVSKQVFVTTTAGAELNCLIVSSGESFELKSCSIDPSKG